MTLPQNVADALSRVHMMVDSESEWADIDIADWQTIRACLLSQEAELADYKNASLHAADDCVAKDAEIARLNRLLESMTNLAVKKDSQIKIAESRLAAANALMGKVYTYLDRFDPNSEVYDEVESHLQGAGDEGGRPA